ncbi:MAG: sigma-54 dependent transcriptional regulator [Firmicutes bacterium]|nr:sigma-54 dependent transcriptional regulator [Bacillota bacterium]
MIWLLRELLAEEYEVLGAGGQNEALKIISGPDPPHLVILDLRLNKEDGLEVLSRVKAMAPATPVLIITAYASVATAVQAIKRGAFDYITKPFDIEEMRLLIRRALEDSGASAPPPGLLDTADGLLRNRIVAKSREMHKIWRLVQKVAPTEATVLITGESGTGKELVARAIHAESPRSQKPFIAVNCAALPENLLESELFGYEEGAFTGAGRRKPGKFELAGGGTILLDEIGDMALSTQVKILRVLEERVVDRLGGTRSIPVDVRIIASTNKDLSYLVRKGQFREDLYFRLAVFPIFLPPLRKRAEDIPLLAEYFLKTFAGKYKKSHLKGFDRAVPDILSRYNWPGNVRELRNTVEQLVILADGPLIRAGDIPSSFGFLSSLVSPGQAGPPEQRATSYKECKDLAESRAIAEALEACGGNRTRAANLLGISRRTLQLKINKYNLT